jgi:predicted nucleic acid-binding protein
MNGLRALKGPRSPAQEADVVAAAVGQFRRKPALSFSDCLVLEVARKAGHLPLGTFDGDLSKLEGAQRL